MIKRIFLWISGLSALFMVPFSFYMSSMFQQSFHNLLKLQVDPRFKGGTLMAVVPDPYKDDHGGGQLVYPEHQSFKPGTADILEYQVYQPQLDAPWSEQSHYWQLAILTAAFSEDHAQSLFRIYLDLDESESDPSIDISDDEAGVLLDRLHGWDYKITVIPLEEKVLLENPRGDLLETLSLLKNAEQQRYIIRLPLKYGLERVLDGRPTYHLLISGFYDPYSRFRPLKRRATLRFPGGAEDRNTPAVVDWLSGPQVSQESVLSHESGELSYIKIVPALPGNEEETGEDSLQSGPETAEQSRDDQNQFLENELLDPELSRQRRGQIYFILGRLEESRNLFQKIWQEEENPLALIYLASIKALDGSHAAPMDAVAMVNEAYALFDQAESIIGDNPELLLDLYIFRGNVSASVPNEVFSKARDGGDDFARAAELTEQLKGDGAEASELYDKAAECYRKAGEVQKARIMTAKSGGLRD